MFVEITKPTLVGSRCHNPGDVIEVEAACGARLVEWGVAVKTDDQPAPPAQDKPTPKRSRRK